MSKDEEKKPIDTVQVERIAREGQYVSGGYFARDLTDEEKKARKLAGDEPKEREALHTDDLVVGLLQLLDEARLKPNAKALARISALEKACKSVHGIIDELVKGQTLTVGRSDLVWSNNQLKDCIG